MTNNCYHMNKELYTLDFIKCLKNNTKNILTYLETYDTTLYIN